MIRRGRSSSPASVWLAEDVSASRPVARPIRGCPSRWSTNSARSRPRAVVVDRRAQRGRASPRVTPSRSDPSGPPDIEVRPKKDWA